MNEIFVQMYAIEQHFHFTICRILFHKTISPLSLPLSLYIFFHSVVVVYAHFDMSVIRTTNGIIFG